MYGNNVKRNEQNNENNSRWTFYTKGVGGYRGGLVLEVPMLVNASGMLQIPDQPICIKLTQSDNCYFFEEAVFAKIMFSWY